jgi:hypothetical protein
MQPVECLINHAYLRKLKGFRNCQGIDLVLRRENKKGASGLYFTIVKDGSGRGNLRGK